MKVRAKKMAFDGLKRVRPGQICEVDDSLIRKDKAGNIIRPMWAEDASKPLAPAATTPYPRRLPEVSESVFTGKPKASSSDVI